MVLNLNYKELVGRLNALPTGVYIKMQSFRIAHFVSRMLMLAALVLFLSACQEKPQTAMPSSDPVKPAIAPGSILLTVQVGSCTEREAKSRTGLVYDCNVIVASVQEYGASTPQLPEGTAIKITIGSEFIDSLPGGQINENDQLSVMVVDTRNTNPNNSDPRWNVNLIL